MSALNILYPFRIFFFFSYLKSSTTVHTFNLGRSCWCESIERKCYTIQAKKKKKKSTENIIYFYCRQWLESCWCWPVTEILSQKQSMIFKIMVINGFSLALSWFSLLRFMCLLPTKHMGPFSSYNSFCVALFLALSIHSFNFFI